MVRVGTSLRSGGSRLLEADVECHSPEYHSAQLRTRKATPEPENHPGYYGIFFTSSVVYVRILDISPLTY